LARSHVFSGKFLGPIAPTPDATFTRYTLTFDIQTFAGVKQAAYVVQYCVSDITGEGFVYLPGRGEPSHRRNISTIIRDGHMAIGIERQMIGMPRWIHTFDGDTALHSCLFPDQPLPVSD